MKTYSENDRLMAERENEEAAKKHPAATGMGAVGGAVIGGLAGAVAGPVGAVVGGAVGAIAGANTGFGAADAIDPDPEPAVGEEKETGPVSDELFTTGEFSAPRDGYDTGGFSSEGQQQQEEVKPGD